MLKHWEETLGKWQLCFVHFWRKTGNRWGEYTNIGTVEKPKVISAENICLDHNALEYDFKTRTDH